MQNGHYAYGNTNVHLLATAKKANVHLLATAKKHNTRFLAHRPKIANWPSQEIHYLFLAWPKNAETPTFE